MRMKKFDPKKIHKLENPLRYSREPMDQIWSWLEIDLPAILLDLGAGSGFFTFQLSERLSANSKIYACDISQDMLNYLQERIPVDKKDQIVTLLSGEGHLPLPNGVVDLVFMANVFHELDDPGQTLAESRRVLKPRGRIAVLEWKKEDMAFGPPLEIRWSAEEIVRQLEECGFSLVRVHSELQAHNFILAVSD